MPSLDRETRNAFNELLLMDELSRLPVGGLLRILQTIPGPVLEAALQSASACARRDPPSACGTMPQR